MSIFCLSKEHVIGMFYDEERKSKKYKRLFERAETERNTARDIAKEFFWAFEDECVDPVTIEEMVAEYPWLKRDSDV